MHSYLHLLSTILEQQGQNSEKHHSAKRCQLKSLCHTYINYILHLISLFSFTICDTYMSSNNWIISVLVISNNHTFSPIKSYKDPSEIKTN